MNIQITDLFPSGVDLLPAKNMGCSIAEVVTSHACSLIEMRNQHINYACGVDMTYTAFSENLVLPYLSGKVGKMSFEHDNMLVLVYLNPPPFKNFSQAQPQPMPYSKNGEVHPSYAGNYIVATVTGFIACAKVSEEGLNSTTMFSVFPIVNDVYVNTTASILTTDLPLAEVLLNSEIVLTKLKLCGAGRYPGNPNNAPYGMATAMPSNSAMPQPQSFAEPVSQYWTTQRNSNAEPMLRPYPLNISPIAPEPVSGQFTAFGVNDGRGVDLSDNDFAEEEDYDEEAEAAADAAEMYQAADVSNGIPANVYYMGRHLRRIPDTDALKATALSLLTASAINPLREFNLDLDYVTKLRTSIGMYGLIERGLSNLVVVIIRGSALAPVIQFIDFDPNTYHIRANVSYAYNVALNKQRNASHIWTLDKTLADYKIPHVRLINQIFKLKGAN
jgi:hypothetical protein